MALGAAFGAPLLAQPQRPNRSYINGVQFGLQPFCYHDLAMTRENRPELIRRLVQNEMGMVELHATWVEPRFNAPGVSAEQARERLRQWRLEAAPDYYRAIRAGFDAAGLDIFTYYVNFTGFTDAELDASFRAAKIIPLDGRPHREGIEPTYYGDSVGRWEGDTLVIDTVNFKRWILDDYHYTDPTKTRWHSDALRTTEHLQRKGDKLLYRITIDDSKIFTRPFSQDFELTLRPDWDKLGLLESCARRTTGARAATAGSAPPWSAA